MPPSSYEIATKRIKDKKKFYRNLASYIIFNSFFFFLNIISDGGHWWFIYPLLGWGIGIASEYYKVFIAPSLEDKAVRKEMGHLEQSRRYYEEEEELELRDLPTEKKVKQEKTWDDSELV